MASTVHILDPGYITQVGHHHNVNELLCRRAREQGIKARILAHQNAQDPGWPDATLRPVFAQPEPYVRYKHPSLFLFDATSAYEPIKAVLDNELGPALEPGDMIVVHTLTYRLLPPLSAWAQALTVGPVALRVSFCTNLVPNYMRPNESLRAHARSVARTAVAYHPPAPGVQVSYYAETAGLAQDIGNVLQCPVTHAPQGIDFSQAPADPGPPEDRVVLAMPGRPRREKGSDLIAAGLPEIFRRRADVQVQCQVESGLPAPSELAEPWPDRLVPVEGPLAPPAFYAALQRCNAVLLPYQPSGYGIRGSHIVVEALGLGRPVLVAEGSWLADFLRQFEPLAGVIMPRYDTAAFVDAVAELIERLPALREAAEAVAPAVRARHDPSRWADRLLQAPSQGPG